MVGQCCGLANCLFPWGHAGVCAWPGNDEQQTLDIMQLPWHHSRLTDPLFWHAQLNVNVTNKDARLRSQEDE